MAETGANVSLSRFAGRMAPEFMPERREGAFCGYNEARRVAIWSARRACLYGSARRSVIRLP